MATANHDDFAFRLQFARHQQREMATEKRHCLAASGGTVVRQLLRRNDDRFS